MPSKGNTKKPSNKHTVETSEKLTCSNVTIVTFDVEKNMNETPKVITVTPAWRWFLK
jgi:hypothetical protein